MAAEEDDGGRQIRLQAHLVAKGNRIDIVLHVKIGAQNHSRCLKNMGVVVTKGARLLDGALGSGDDVLLLDRLDPEARREVGQVRNERDKWPAGVDGVPAFADFAIEVRDDGDQKVGGVFAPEFLEQAHHRAMEEPDRNLKHAQEILAAEGPAVLQDDVVLLLDADAGQFAKHVEAIGQVLELHQLHLPSRCPAGPQSSGGRWRHCDVRHRVMEENVDFFHGWRLCHTL